MSIRYPKKPKIDPPHQMPFQTGFQLGTIKRSCSVAWGIVYISFETVKSVLKQSCPVFAQPAQTSHLVSLVSSGFHPLSARPHQGTHFGTAVQALVHETAIPDLRDQPQNRFFREKNDLRKHEPASKTHAKLSGLNTV